MTKAAALAVSLVVIVGASGCAASPAAYAPAIGGGPGYSQTLSREGRYTVAFRGNSRTSEASVKQMLFYRAAELALEQGHDAFTVVAQGARFTGGDAVKGDSPFAPVMSRSYSHNLFGMISSREWSVSTPRAQSQQYEAEIEIIMMRGDVSPDLGVFDAREVIAALKDHVLAP
jgi:hypothetical protein